MASEDDEHGADNLWERLSGPVVARILDLLPFSCLRIASRVCEDWREYISCRPRLVYTDRNQLFVQNPSNCLWDVTPVASLLEHDLSGSPPPFHPFLSDFHVLASAGGLLCFSVNFLEHLVVCNSLTGTFRTVEVPWGDRTSDAACLPIFLRRCRPNCELLPFISWVGLVTDSCTGIFKMVLECAGRRIVYDSNSQLWRKSKEIPGGATILRDHMSCNGDVYSTRGIRGSNLDLFKYDVHRDTWHAISVPESCTFPWAYVEHEGKVLLMAGCPDTAQTLAFFELRESHAVAWSSEKSATIISMFDTFRAGLDDSEVLEGLSCAGLGEVVFFMAHKSVGLGRNKKISFKAGFYDFSTKSKIFGGWNHPNRTRNQQMYTFSQILQPSFIRCR